jgi:hypothetical protein
MCLRIVYIHRSQLSAPVILVVLVEKLWLASSNPTPPLAHRSAIHRSADKFLACPIFLFAAQPKEFFMDGLKKLEQ